MTEAQEERFSVLFCSVEWTFVGFFCTSFWLGVSEQIIFIRAAGLEWQAWWVEWQPVVFPAPYLIFCPWCWLWSSGPGHGGEVREGPGSFSWRALVSVVREPEEQVGQGSIFTCHLPVPPRLLQYGYLERNSVKSCLKSTRKEWRSRKCRLAGRSLKSLEDLSSWS